mmetsp:Transcript_19313/g.44004  ORF Transcript_19313/g.44004 Transcript_19313/m.44004 type:complete len:82 (-) Transcript_19313:434-679(-)
MTSYSYKRNRSYIRIMQCNKSIKTKLNYLNLCISKLQCKCYISISLLSSSFTILELSLSAQYSSSQIALPPFFLMTTLPSL